MRHHGVDHGEELLLGFDVEVHYLVRDIDDLDQQLRLGLLRAVLDQLPLDLDILVFA